VLLVRDPATHVVIDAAHTEGIHRLALASPRHPARPRRRCAVPPGPVPDAGSARELRWWPA